MDVLDHLLADARRRRMLPPPAIRRVLRERAGLSQRELAVVVGVTRPTITRYESGEREPRGKTCLAYVEALERLAGKDESSPIDRSGSPMRSAPAGNEGAPEASSRVGGQVPV